MRFNVMYVCSVARFVELQKAKDTLTDPDKRRLYDAWRNSGLTYALRAMVGQKGPTADGMVLCLCCV